jgi:hypothetical protein
MGFQFFQTQVFTQFHVAQKAHSRVFGNFFVLEGDRFDFLVIGSHTVAHQAIRSGQTVDQVDGNRILILFEQRFGNIKSRRASTDNGNAEGSGQGVFAHVGYLEGGCFGGDDEG